MRAIWIKVLFAALVAVGVLATTASGSHFRYGNYTWVNTGPTTTEFSLTNAWRRSGYSGSGGDGFPVPGDVIQEFVGATSFNFGDASATGVLSYLVTSIDITNDWLFAVALDPANLPAQDTTIDHTYAAAGDVLAFTDSCCRIGNNINASNGFYRVETLVNVGGTNRPPVSTLPPIVNCPIMGLCSFQVPASDADGDALTYRLSTGAESGITTQPGPPFATNAAAISSSGLYTWDTNGATLALSGPTYYATQVTIEDRTAAGALKSKIAVDFLIQLVTVVGTPPAFVSPTPTCGSTVNGSVGSAMTFTVAASDADAGNTVTLTAAGVPVGATLTPPLPASGNPVQTVFSWTPSGPGTSVVIFAATDNTGNQALCSLTLVVAQAAAADLSVTKSDSPDPIEVGEELTYTITVSNAGPDAAQNVSLSDTLPAGVTLVSATASQGSCSGSAPVVCSLGTIAASGSATVTIKVTPNSAGTISNTASVSSSTADPSSGNNSATAETLVNAPAVPQGCSHGYWKTHESAWVGYSPGQTVGSVFSGAGSLASKTLSEALAFRGGSSLDGAKQNLLKQAVAALLNAAHPDVDYPKSTAQVMSDVNAALASNNRSTILTLANTLDQLNNLGCPL